MAKVAAAATALDQAKIAKVRVERTLKVGVVARTPARPKTAVANRLNHRHQVSSLHLPELDLMVVKVAVGVKARRMVETAQEVTVVVVVAVAAVVAEIREVEATGMETMETEVPTEEMAVQAGPMEVTAMAMAQDLARKIHSCWEGQLTALIWEDWSFN